MLVMTNEGFVVVSLAPISDFTFHTYLHTSYVFNNYFFPLKTKAHTHSTIL